MELSLMKSKTLKVGSDENEDRISRLPDSILSHILSFLPTNYAVQTCVLSSRWKFVWTSFRNLIFDFSLWHKNGSPTDSWARFEIFINRMLLLSDSVNIDKFSITCVDYDVCKEGFRHLKSWVSVAIKRNVRVLELAIDNFLADELPGSIYSSRSLEVVKLNLIFIIETPPPEVCFPNVKILQVKVHDQGNNYIDSLFCRCPVLEDLSINALFFCGDDTHFNISSTTLKRLNLIVEQDPIKYYEFYHQVMVRAPNLECLCISDFMVVSYVLHELLSLTTADIAISMASFDPEVEAFSPEISANNVHHLLQGITNTKSLSLSAWIIHILDSSIEALFPTFPNLTYLKVKVGECDWRSLPIILSRMPILNEFVFEKYYDEYMMGTIAWDEPPCVPDCLSLHLTQIEIRGFEGKKNELMLVKYLLKNGKALKRMTIGFKTSASTNEHYEKLLMFERGSSSCQVEIFG